MARTVPFHGLSERGGLAIYTSNHPRIFNASDFIHHHNIRWLADMGRTLWVWDYLAAQCIWCVAVFQAKSRMNLKISFFVTMTDFDPWDWEWHRMTTIVYLAAIWHWDWIKTKWIWVWLWSQIESECDTDLKTALAWNCLNLQSALTVLRWHHRERPGLSSNPLASGVLSTQFPKSDLSRSMQSFTRKHRSLKIIHQAGITYKIS